MRKLSIKDLVEFRNKTNKSKKNFAIALLKDRKIEGSGGGGGDYWVSSVSAISNSFKLSDLRNILAKKSELEEKCQAAKRKETRNMYKRNIDILYNFEDFDMKKWRPSKKLSFLHKYKNDSIITVKDLQIQASPHHIFTFSKNDLNQIGAIWFIAKLNGYEKDELGMFADILFRVLRKNYSNDYNLDSRFCIAVDVFNKEEVNYSQLEKGEVKPILNPTLDEIKKLV